jgi:DNA-binding response OmpR family regulator
MNTPAQSRTVLLVEDSDDDAFFFERAFVTAAVPAQLTRVENGGAAVEYLERAARASRDLSRTHVVFLDLKTPGLNGFDVLKWIREHGVTVEVLVLSGSDLDSDRETALRLGAADYLVKPISARELSRRLAREEIAK